jgi:nucleoside-diphosphate-sugar epimerase
MRVLVAGDRGYLGAVIVPFPQQAGHDVVGLNASWYVGNDFRSPPAGYEQSTGDIRCFVQPDDLARLDSIINLAAVSDHPVGDLNPTATYSVNADGAIHLGRLAKAAGVPRYVFSPSCSLYGAAAADKPCAAPFNPVTPYGEGESARRGRAVPAGRRRLQPHSSQKRDGARRVPDRSRAAGGS